MFSRLNKIYFIYMFSKYFCMYFCINFWLIKLSFLCSSSCLLNHQIILSPNLVFGLMIHPDSELLHHLFICTANSYCTILLHIIVRSALFNTSVLPVSAINCRLDSLCIRRCTPLYLYGIACVALFL